MIKAVIFDLDGVLVNTEPIWYDTFKQVTEEFGLEYSDKLHSLTPGRYNAALILVRALGIEEKHEQFVERCREIYKKDFMEKAEPVPGALDLLEKLKGHYKIGLATSAYRPRLTYNLEKFPEFNNFFDTTTSGEEVERSKPAPDIYLFTARKLEVAPENCLVVEDAEAGVAAGKAAGMKVVGFKQPGAFPQELTKADKIVTSLVDIDPQTF